MASPIVGDLYKEIIEEVINESRVDFEDNGVDETTLKELQELWQQRLTAMNVAKFPWNPEEYNIADQAQLGINMSAHEMVLGNTNFNLNNSSYLLDHNATTATGVEPSNLAAIRAAQQIQQFTQGNDGVNAESTQETIRGLMRQSGIDPNAASAANEGDGLVLPGGGRLSQLDGTSDIELLNLSARIKSIANNDKTKKKQTNKLKTDKLDIPINKNSKKQLDGTGDEEDENAINSDLDDSDDGINSQDNDSDDEGGTKMFCLYDKVHRAKSKWKFNLKDGVVCIDGKDYIFSKGNGECEW